jgi:hypothetical protein
MQRLARFRVHSSFVAIRGAGHFVTVPAGAVMETLSEPRDPGLVPVVVDGNHRMAWTRDISEMAEWLGDRS